MGPDPALYFKVPLVNSRIVFFSLMLFPKSKSILWMTERPFMLLIFRNTVSIPPFQWKIAVLCYWKNVPSVTGSLLGVMKIQSSLQSPTIYLKSDLSHLDSGVNSLEVAGFHQNYEIEKCFTNLQFPFWWKNKEQTQGRILFSLLFFYPSASLRHSASFLLVFSFEYWSPKSKINKILSYRNMYG